MSLNEDGIIGEGLARKLILRRCNPDILFGADWIFKRKSKWYLVEVKYKEMFESPPFDGQGTDIKQIISRLQFQKDTNIRCIFLALDKITKKAYWNYLDDLEKTKYFDTKNGARIYNIKYFKEIKWEIK